MGTEFSVKQEGGDYYFLIMKHMDRMSEGLNSGIDVGKINTQHLLSYYEKVLHLESLLFPFLDKKYYELKEKHIKFPKYSTTWSQSIGTQMEYFNATSDLFQLLLVYAYKESVLKIKLRKDYKFNERFGRELFE